MARRLPTFNHMQADVTFHGVSLKRSLGYVCCLFHSGFVSRKFKAHHLSVPLRLSVTKTHSGRPALVVSSRPEGFLFCAKCLHCTKREGRGPSELLVETQIPEVNGKGELFADIKILSSRARFLPT